MSEERTAEMAAKLADAQAPSVTDEELDLTAVLPTEDRYYKTHVVWRELNEDGSPSSRSVTTTVERFPIRARLPIPTMTSLLRLETRINEALAKDDEESDFELEKLLDLAHEQIVGLIVERSPDAFAPRSLERANGEDVQAVGAIELDVDQILVTLGWIAGDTSVADAVARALTAGRSPAKTEDEVQTEGEARGDETAADAGPLASKASS